MRRALLAAVTAGCGPLLGIDGSFSAPDAGPPITNHVGVVGHASITYHTELATLTVPEDLSQRTIDAYILDDTGLHVYPGTGTADGQFTIPDVPARDYHLRITSPQGGLPAIWHLQGHDVDLSRDEMGQPGLTPLAPGALISLTAPAMRRYLSRDELELYSSLVPHEVLPSWLATRPVLGLDHLDRATLDWGSRPALDDNGVWVVHHGLPEATPEGLNVTTITEAAHVAGLRQTSGVLPLSFVFARGMTANTTMVVDIALLRPQRSLVELATLDIIATPDRGSGTMAGPVVLSASYQPDTRAPVTQHFVDYADPFPATWSRTAQVSYYNFSRLLLRPPSIQAVLGDRIVAREVTAPGSPLVVPSLAARPPGPTAITLDGEPIRDAVRVPAAPLRLAWDPVPAATSYLVSFIVMSPEGEDETYEVATTLPSLELPGGTFADQHHLAVSIGVALGDALEPAIRRQPRRRTLYEHTAALVMMSSTCGNGIVDAGDASEACDTAGESETCNFDCTLPRCGDAITNAAAHEDCDLGFATPTCDGACHAVVCGDGVVSTSGEQCDDGNTDGGDGCAADCYVEALTRCGDGVVDPGEQCDDGNDDPLDVCSSACKVARCDDGVVSVRAGEECDDRNSITGDGCSVFCRVERCGDGFLIYPEQCDDTNTLPGDGCAPDCRRE
jgi:cysteine-rich repeat protein